MTTEPKVVDRSATEAIEIELLLTAVARRWGYDFREYSPATLRRRIRRAMQLESVHSISALQERILHDEQSMIRFIQTLTVHVTSMFRDPEMYAAFRKKVVPLLRTWPFARIWHAGCSTGQEVYSMAILLEEEGIYDRCRIYATDLSDDLVQRAKRGIYPLSSMQDYTYNYQRAGGTREFSEYYSADAENAVLKGRLRRNVVFSQHNLVSDASFNDFHVIICRNVMIYFGRDLRERVHGLLYESLVRFGVLVLGLKETVDFTPYSTAFEAVDPALKMYRRLR